MSVVGVVTVIVGPRAWDRDNRAGGALGYDLCPCLSCEYETRVRAR